MANPLEGQGTRSNGRGEGAPVRSELLREVNERIREVGRNGPVCSLEVLCECGGGDCVAMVELTTREYDGIRRGTGLVLAQGHSRA
jgi:hypothetical protein